MYKKEKRELEKMHYDMQWFILGKLRREGLVINSKPGSKAYIRARQPGL